MAMGPPGLGPSWLDRAAYRLLFAGIIVVPLVVFAGAPLAPVAAFAALIGTLFALSHGRDLVARLAALLGFVPGCVGATLACYVLAQRRPDSEIDSLLALSLSVVPAVLALLFVDRREALQRMERCAAPNPRSTAQQ
jgi:hypothetical protein